MSGQALRDLSGLIGIPEADLPRVLALLRAVVTPDAHRRIDPDVLYTAPEANARLGFGERLTIYEIPETDLPKCRVGAGRGSVRYLGADLLAYARGLDVPDLQPVLDGARVRLEDRMGRPSPVVGTVGAGRGQGRRRIV
ncbi:MAG: hypothetical protein AAF791_11990 [Bacteroidota bacterium]